ncbi:RNA polymerase sigma-70 factor [Sulfitobacter noctilucicola]|uniref:RNA polymerase sigma-70 factor (ECF subfamily) n=1 Tax=Sulfitobacter noctilucicola TaxID=1342301 RepID=A0A7W6M4Z0_9RHOB|nr:RNA polymerase sigma factor [Sulfitobacter noctilucicola]KIN62942.1 RNA polymerase sigma-70 factor [Sulfitobacter noctilucicola]MBB4172530.1 RNA polymerase sigma-70 factor (ECF subfamily) [Sulfitobacter noctilucicola]
MTAASDPRDELVEHLPAMRAFAISLTRNGSIADDMVQDTLVKAWTNIEKFEVGTNMRAWLFTILRNTYYSNRRKAKREVADVDGVFTESLAEKPAHDGHMQMADFRRALLQLKDEQREALLLVGASGFSYEEAAEMCGVAVGTIKSRTNRARAQLAEIMGLNEDEPLEMTDDATMSVLSGSKIASF